MIEHCHYEKINYSCYKSILETWCESLIYNWKNSSCNINSSGILRVTIILVVQLCSKEPNSVSSSDDFQSILFLFLSITKYFWFSAIYYSQLYPTVSFLDCGNQVLSVILSNTSLNEINKNYVFFCIFLGFFVKFYGKLMWRPKIMQY